MVMADNFADGETSAASDQSETLRYAVDVVFAIDLTGSMVPVIERVKASALSFDSELSKVMAEKGKGIAQLRVRIVGFRDFLDSAAPPLEQSRFFTLPDERGDFESFVRGLTASGSGDGPASGLEALGVAFRSEWETHMDFARHVIVLFTDAAAHPLEAAASVESVPADVPRTMDDLVDVWEGGAQSGGMDHEARRLLICAPDVTPWTDISDSWEMTLHFESRAGEGMDRDTLRNVARNIRSAM